MGRVVRTDNDDVAGFRGAGGLLMYIMRPSPQLSGEWVMQAIPVSRE